MIVCIPFSKTERFIAQCGDRISPFQGFNKNSLLTQGSAAEQLHPVLIYFALSGLTFHTLNGV